MMSKLLLVFLLFSSLALGATNIPDSHIIYTWGYGEMIYNVLEAVRMAIRNTEVLVKSVLLLAFYLLS